MNASRKLSLSRSGYYWTGALFCFVIGLLRHAWIFQHAEFWAEDGTEFFRCTIEFGGACLTTPVTGYFLTLPRLIAGLVSWLPVEAAPYGYTLICLALSACCAAYVIRSSFVYLIPSIGHRWWVAVGIALAPGSAEVFHNLSNLQMPLTWLALLMLIEERERFSVGEVFLLLLIFFSTSSALILGPVIAFRYYQTRKRDFLVVGGLLVGSIVVNALDPRNIALRKAYQQWGTVSMALQIYIEQCVVRYFINPFLGPGASTWLLHRSQALTFWAVSILPIALWVVAIRRARIRPVLYLMGVVAASIALYYPLIGIFRAYTAGNLYRPFGSVLWIGRYGFLAGAFAVLFWNVVAAALLRNHPRGARLIWIWLAIPALVCAPRMFPQPELNWRQKSLEIAEGLNQRQRGELNALKVVTGIRAQPAGSVVFSVVIQPR